MIANTGRRHRDRSASTSRPTPTWSPTGWPGEIDEERGWGIQRRHASPSSSGSCELGAPDWFRLSDRDLATCLYRTPLHRRGRHADRRPGADRARRSASRPRCCRCASEPVRTRVLTPDGWRGLQEFLIVDRVAGRRSRGSRSRGSPRPRRRRRCCEALAGAEAIVDRPLEPGDLDRPDPRRARACARRSPRADAPGGRGQPARRRHGRSRARPSSSWRRVGRPVHARPAWPRCTRA